MTIEFFGGPWDGHVARDMTILSGTWFITPFSGPDAPGVSYMCEPYEPPGDHYAPLGPGPNSRNDGRFLYKWRPRGGPRTRMSRSAPPTSVDA